MLQKRKRELVVLERQLAEPVLAEAEQQVEQRLAEAMLVEEDRLLALLLVDYADPFRIKLEFYSKNSTRETDSGVFVLLTLDTDTHVFLED